jgi:hypothetical protein
MVDEDPVEGKCLWRGCIIVFVKHSLLLKVRDTGEAETRLFFQRDGHHSFNGVIKQPFLIFSFWNGCLSSWFTIILLSAS